MARTAKIYVSGLPLVWSDRDLVAAFERFGKILNARVLFEQNTGVSRGVGFVTFENQDEAQAAIDGLNGEKVDTTSKTPLKVLMAKKHDELKAEGEEGGGGAAVDDIDPACNVMVNYLPESWREPELRQLFQAVGSVRKLKVVVDKVTQQSKCYGFVLYDTPEDAQRACTTLNGRVVQNKSIKVAMAVREEEGKLYIGNFPVSWGDADMEQLLQPFGSVVSVRVLYDKATGLSRGCGFAAMKNKDEAQCAIDALSGVRVDGSQQGLKIHFPVEPKNRSEDSRNGGSQGAGPQNKKRRMDGGSLMGDMSMDKSGLGMDLGMGFTSGYGASPQNSMMYGQNTSYGNMGQDPSSPTSGDQVIFVHGLDEQVEDIELWQLFGPIGAVKNVRVIRGKDGRSQGYGFVTMVRPHEAREAISQLNGRTYAKKMLQVRFKGGSSMDSTSGFSMMQQHSSRY